MSIRVKRFHRSWHVPIELIKSDTHTVRPEFLELYLTFMQHKVWLQLERDGEVTPEDEQRITDVLEQRIINSLENNCTGFWTADFEEEEENRDLLSVFIMFQKEEDLLNYLKTDGMMFRLEF